MRTTEEKNESKSNNVGKTVKLDDTMNQARNIEILSTTGVIDFNASNLTGVLAGDDRSLALSVPVVNDDIDEDDELFVLLLELVSAVNPDRVDLSERNISLLQITDDDGECDRVCVCFC